MENFTILLKRSSLFFKAQIIVILSSFFYLILVGKDDVLIPLDAHHPFWLNVFFINYTFMGDAAFAICLIGILFFFKKREQGLALLYGFLISGIAIQVIKNFTDLSHLKLFSEEGQYLFFVGEVSLAYNHFPSGHTAIAFAIATVLVMLVKNSKWQFLLLAGAILVGFSRVYLAQHFLVDILAGAIIGVLSGMIGVYFACHIKGTRVSFNKMKLSKASPTMPSFN